MHIKFIRWVAQVWRETPLSLRVATLVMWFAGTAMVALGSVGDSKGFWTSRPFLTNLASSVTGAAFGIPLALLVLQRIAVGEAERQETRTMKRLARNVACDMYQVVMSILVDPGSSLDERIAALKPIITNLAKIDEAVRKAMNNAIDYGEDDRMRIIADQQEYDKWRDLQRQFHKAYPTAMADFEAVLDVSKIPAAKQKLLDHWRYLLDEVQPRVRASGGSYLDLDRIEEFTKIARQFRVRDPHRCVDEDDYREVITDLTDLQQLMTRIRSIEDFFWP